MILRGHSSPVPVIPGSYVDYAGDAWTLDEKGYWSDKNGHTRPRHMNPLLHSLQLRPVVTTAEIFAQHSLSFDTVTNEDMRRLTRKVEGLTKAVTRYKKKAARANDRADKNLALYKFALSRLVAVSRSIHPILSAVKAIDPSSAYGILQMQNPTRGVTYAHSDMQLRTAHQQYEIDMAEWAAIAAEKSRLAERSLPAITITATNLTPEVLDILSGGLIGQTEQAPDADF